MVVLVVVVISGPSLPLPPLPLHTCALFLRAFTQLCMRTNGRADTRKTERAPYDMCAGVFDCNSETDGELEIRRSELVRIECALWESRERTQR